MEPIGKVVDRLPLQNATQPPSRASPAPATEASHSPSTALPSAWIERIFTRMAAMYGNRFAQMWAGVDPEAIKATWAEGLGHLTPGEISDGLDACKSRDWPPSMPEFIRLCRQPPDYFAMFVEASHGNWRSALTYWAAARFGFFELRTTSWEHAKTTWIRAVDETRAMQALPDIPERETKALPAPGRTYTRDKAAAAVHEMREILARKRA